MGNQLGLYKEQCNDFKIIIKCKNKNRLFFSNFGGEKVFQRQTILTNPLYN